MYKQIIVIFFLVFLSCEKEEILSPDKKILGKWKLIETGTWPYLERPTSDVYLLFYHDSIMMQYDAHLKSKNYCDYWVDSVLHLIQYDVNPTPIHYMINYTFYENKLRLDRNEDYTRIYQRMPF
jgi:hypothetical protein